MILNTFRNDLTNISAKKEALVNPQMIKTTWMNFDEKVRNEICRILKRYGSIASCKGGPGKSMDRLVYDQSCHDVRSKVQFRCW